MPDESLLTHVDETGAARMVDVSAKDVSTRVAVAAGRLALRGDSAHSYMAYLDIHDEPFDVYPAVKDGENK